MRGYGGAGPSLARGSGRPPLRTEAKLRFLAGFVGMILFLALLGGAGVLFIFYHYGRDLPDYRQLADYDPPTVTRLHAGDGRLLVEYATEKRVYVPVQAIPRRVVNAFLSAEDKNFYSHPGVDFISVARAIVTNMVNLARDRRPVGASTITQQVAKACEEPQVGHRALGPDRDRLPFQSGRGAVVALQEAQDPRDRGDHQGDQGLFRPPGHLESIIGGINQRAIRSKGESVIRGIGHSGATILRYPLLNPRWLWLPLGNPCVAIVAPGRGWYAATGARRFERRPN